MRRTGNGCLGAVLACVIGGLSSSPATAAAQRGVDRVPEEFATLQQAIDQGNGRVIRVASGEYAGAVVTREVALVCAGQCMITSGVPVTANSHAGFVLEGGASGSRIHGFDFVDLELGVFASCETIGSAADDVTVTGNAFVNTAQGVTVNGLGCEGGRGWRIVGNRVQDLRSDIGECGGGLGVYLIAADDADVIGNVFRGTIAALPCGPVASTAAIYLTGTEGARIAGNDIEMGDGGHPFKFDIALFAEDGGNRDTVMIFNDASGSAAPFEGINFLSVDGFELTARCNTGTTSIEHTNSDGRVEQYGERGCRRLPAP